MRTWLFREKSYKTALERLIEESQASRGIISKIADAIGCQRSYLSQVLHSKVQLTKEQAWGVCRFFSLTPEESRYFELLVDWERSALPAYRRHLESELEKLREEAGKISKQFHDTTKFTEAEALDHFVTWLPTAVHMLTSIPGFQEPDKIATRLQVALPVVLATLNSLEARGLVKQQKGRWVFAKGTGYIPRESLYVMLHHQNWRQIAVEDSRNPRSNGLHYTMVQTMSRQDFEKLKEMVIRFIAETKKVADPSPAEELTALNIDFFLPR